MLLKVLTMFLEGATIQLTIVSGTHLISYQNSQYADYLSGG